MIQKPLAVGNSYINYTGTQNVGFLMKHPTLWSSKPSVVRLFYNHLEPLLACVCTGIAAEAREASVPINIVGYTLYTPFLDKPDNSLAQGIPILAWREQLSFDLMIPDSS